MDLDPVTATTSVIPLTGPIFGRGMFARRLHSTGIRLGLPVRDRFAHRRVVLGDALLNVVLEPLQDRSRAIRIDPVKPIQ